MRLIVIEVVRHCRSRYFDLSSGISPRLFSCGTQAALPSAMAFMQSR
jgi:hypothetical protein